MPIFLSPPLLLSLEFVDLRGSKRGGADLPIYRRNFGLEQFPLGNLVTLDLLCGDPCRESPVVGIPVVWAPGGWSRDPSSVV